MAYCLGHLGHCLIDVACGVKDTDKEANGGLLFLGRGALKFDPNNTRAHNKEVELEFWGEDRR